MRQAERQRAAESIMPTSASVYRKIYAIVSSIPQGRVATYGQIARLVGMPGHARLVGYALSCLHDRATVPWHRIVNAKGQISVRSDGSPADMIQRLRLESEGVSFDEHDRIPLGRFQWQPESSEDSPFPPALRSS
ncbi:MGMT family protein [Geobacter sp. AOG2]|uniref:MGMT family protein n=1 Tax=Geobacter sp. AOG2 TaxID=1566347 RepID=UPI0027E4BF5F|nr:MGMT family protein [Geobacter sp. AOG2]